MLTTGSRCCGIVGDRAERCPIERPRSHRDGVVAGVGLDPAPQRMVRALSDLIEIAGEYPGIEGDRKKLDILGKALKLYETARRAGRAGGVSPLIAWSCQRQCAAIRGLTPPARRPQRSTGR